jgi:hypothetical protein
MGSSDAEHRRSGDPRKRAAAGTASPVPRGPRWAVVAALAMGSALVCLALLLLQVDQGRNTTTSGSKLAGSSVDARARTHAEAACNFTRKAEQAAQAAEVDGRTRYAAAVLMLDWAIIESGRAAQADTALAELDTALQAVHAAGHEGDHDGWQDALGTASAECGAVLGGG